MINKKYINYILISIIIILCVICMFLSSYDRNHENNVIRRSHALTDNIYNNEIYTIQNMSDAICDDKLSIQFLYGKSSVFYGENVNFAMVYESYDEKFQDKLYDRDAFHLSYQAVMNLKSYYVHLHNTLKSIESGECGDVRRDEEFKRLNIELNNEINHINEGIFTEMICGNKDEFIQHMSKVMELSEKLKEITMNYHLYPNKI